MRLDHLLSREPHCRLPRVLCAWSCGVGCVGCVGVGVLVFCWGWPGGVGACFVGLGVGIGEHTVGFTLSTVVLVCHCLLCVGGGGWGCWVPVVVVCVVWGVAAGWVVGELYSGCEHLFVLWFCLVFVGIRWMPWYQELMKDVAACEMPRGVGKRVLIRGCPNGGTWLGLCLVTIA